MNAHETGAAPPEQPRKRILLVDDHPLMRAGLAQLIADEPDLTVCGEAGDAASALDQFTKLKPDLVIADIALPGRDGLELIKDLHAYAPEVPVLVVSMQDEEFYAERALRAGARGYLMKEAGGESVLQAIRQALDGGIYVSPAMSAKILTGFSNGKGGRYAAVAQLTDREFEIMRCVGAGKGTAIIAAELHLSEKTIDVHRYNIRRKLGLTDSTALIHFAVKWVEHENSQR